MTHGKMIKLIVSDVDSTLVEDSSKWSESGSLFE